MYMQGMSDTALGGIPVWMGNNLAWLIEPGVPLFETLIGLALIAGAFTRLAAFGGVIFMTLFLGRQRRVRPRTRQQRLHGPAVVRDDDRARGRPVLRSRRDHRSSTWSNSTRNSATCSVKR